LRITRSVHFTASERGMYRTLLFVPSIPGYIVQPSPGYHDINLKVRRHSLLNVRHATFRFLPRTFGRSARR
jgi:hypothetical protein